ncbi:unnamed protein product [Aphanomyces euteiches]|uniref:Uncharacterized protein n=1 Tax=Aphanomyces euteiches TaxID=100861 RepID=A0A6G0WW17_9STRA|nr:hypothetical protein Ae201684_011054 [Aphanomyces euteiches]KAH9058505.1 hypothetical protein Ae201684P_005848 [Aphanomyces euteiches]KAH9132843.1 hypothetical protein AeRB84_020907 [Aphanomyces euteiches]
MPVGLVLGMDGAGKTTLLRQLSHSYRDAKHSKLVSVLDMVRSRLFVPTDDKTPKFLDHITTVPTTGLEEESIVHRDMHLTLREVGAPMLSMWSAYYDGCDFYVFLVDMANIPQLGAAAIEFFNVVQAMETKAGFLVFNKCDAPCSASVQWVRSLFCLDQLSTSSNMNILQVSAARGLHLDTLVDAIVNKLSRPNNRQFVQTRIHPTN